MSINMNSTQKTITDSNGPSHINFLSVSSTPEVGHNELCRCSPKCVIDLDEEELKDEEEVIEEELSEDDATYSIEWGPTTRDPDWYLPGAWTTQSLEIHPWDDTYKPVVKFHDYKDLKLNPKESEGILSDRIIASCSTYLDKSPETGKYVLCKVNLSRKSLADVRILGYHHSLQYVDLSWNLLKDLTPLNQLPFLMYLDVSHNQLDEILSFRAPLNLTYVNYSFNCVPSLRNLSEFWSIVYLDVSHNYIKKIEGLQELKYLRHLNLSFNEINKIQNLNYMALLTLNLQNNMVSKFEIGPNVGLKTLNSLLRINLDGNKLNTLKLFEFVPSLQSLSCQNNRISELIEITYLSQLNFLNELDLRGNPVAEVDKYLDICINNVRRIILLDGDVIDAEKKIAVKHQFEPTSFTSSYKSAATSLFLQNLNDPFLGLPLVPFDSAYVPIIILVGTPASRKGSLSKLLCHRHSRYTVYGISHTTRPKTNDDETDAYYFIETDKFWEMAQAGEFLTVSQILGHNFGFSQTEFGRAIAKPCVLVLHMDLKGALTIRAKNSKTHLVLAMPSTEEVHSKFICEKYYNTNHSTCGGANIVMNCPEKAKEFQEESEYIIQAQPKEFATEIIGDVLKYIIPEDIGEGDENESYRKSYSMNSSLDNCRKIKRMNSEPINILKSFRKSYNESGVLSSPYVKFVSDVTLDKRHSINIGSSQGVTYSSLQYENPIKSISETYFSENEQLSVLSETAYMEKKKSANEIWEAQMDALNAVTHSILNIRESYLQFHKDNPGIFSEVVFTDEEDVALTKLKKLLKNCISNQQNVPCLYYKQDSAYQSIIETRLKEIRSDINSEMSIGQKQHNEHKYYMPKDKPSENQLKTHKQEIIESMATHRKTAINYTPAKEIRTRRKSSLSSRSTF